MNGIDDHTGCLTLLSNLLLAPDTENGSEQIAQAVANYGHEEITQLLGFATTHHVILRAFPRLSRATADARKDWTEWIENAIAREGTRIQNALSFLSPICEALEGIGDVIVIKSLDHWPDLGSDLDLYTTADGVEVADIMGERFQARMAEKSWGDRLANKWNFIIPGLPELVEVHAGRLGQTGEQVDITDSLIARANGTQFGARHFRVPSAEDRVIISTLQRMYRHFYLRLCDVADIARLVDCSAIDYVYLESLARPAGLWDGLATYLVVVSEYVQSYRGKGLPLPSSITSAARFGSADVSFRQKFLRIPIFPQAASLYAKEWKNLLFNGELQNTLRLSLLPGLAVAAVLALRITGSDKGIW
jgi:hypothetical protein